MSVGGLDHFGEFISCQTDLGSERSTGFRKLPNVATPIGVWYDLSYAAGNPVPNYYAASPLVSTTLTQSADKGIFHGSNVTPKKKFLDTATVICNTVAVLPMPMILCDYLLFYPFIDEGTTDEQALTNSISLPRWSDGVGVQIMAISQAARVGGQSFTIKYTNSDGVAGRVTSSVIENVNSQNGNIVTSATNTDLSAGPFIPLQSGDIGVRLIESVTMNGLDVGLFALVLIKPLFTTQVFQFDCPVENQTLKDRSCLPEIKDDAYLNFICLPQSSLSAVPVFGSMRFIFN